MSILETLTAESEEVPEWLAAYSESTPLNAETFEALLRSRVVFYPGSGLHDGETFEVFTRSHSAHCVVHADYLCSAASVDPLVNRQIHGPYVHIAGYRPVRAETLDAEAFRVVANLDDGHAFDREAQLGDAFWAVLQREPGFTDAHGPARIAFLHVQCEAVWLFWNLWARHHRGPYAMLIQDHGFGGNWDRFGNGGALHQLANRHTALPKWLLVGTAYGGTGIWKDYFQVSDPTPLVNRRLPDALGGGTYHNGGRVLCRHSASVFGPGISSTP